MNKLYLSFFLLLTGTAVLAQETTAPVLRKSNRIILHFTDTAGKFTQLARIFIDRGYDIDMKDRELGILRTKPSPLRGGTYYSDQVEIKTIFRDSTITFTGVTYTSSSVYGLASSGIEVTYSRSMFRNIMLSWVEMEKVAELLQPAFITYTRVDVTEKTQQPESWYRRHN